MENNIINTGQIKILLVDDVPENLQILQRTLAPGGYNLSLAQNGEAALDIVSKARPDLILLDIMMPGMDGFQVCTRLKEKESTRTIPIIFITARSHAEDIVKGFKLGCVDYITKPFNFDEVRARVRTHAQLQALTKERTQIISELNRVNESFDELSKTDPLTGLSNRRSLLAILETEKIRFEHCKIIFSVLIGALEGHSVLESEDQALIEVSTVFKTGLGPLSKAGRWGEDQFLVVLPGVGLEEAIHLAETLQKKINGLSFGNPNKPVKLSMSFGIDVYQKGDFLEDFIYHAEGLLAKAKETGRNQVVSSLP